MPAAGLFIFNQICVADKVNGKSVNHQCFSIRITFIEMYTINTCEKVNAEWITQLNNAALLY